MERCAVTKNFCVNNRNVHIFSYIELYRNIIMNITCTEPLFAVCINHGHLYAFYLFLLPRLEEIFYQTDSQETCKGRIKSIFPLKFLHSREMYNFGIQSVSCGMKKKLHILKSAVLLHLLM